MSLLNAGVYAVHLVAAALWTGSVLFVSYAVVPMASDGELNAGPLGSLAGRLRTVSRTSALVLLLTGGHMAVAAAGYTVDTLLGSTRGHLLVGMILLWVALAGLVEVGAARLADGAGRQKVREPAREARRLLQGASVVAVLLLVDAAVLVSSGLGVFTL
jgi:uncharacterized membrane protein